MHDNYMEGMAHTRSLMDLETFSTIGGPAMSAKQNREYRKNLKKRFHKMNGNWDLRLFGEYRL